MLVISTPLQDTHRHSGGGDTVDYSGVGSVMSSPPIHTKRFWKKLDISTIMNNDLSTELLEQCQEVLALYSLDHKKPVFLNRAVLAHI